METMHFWTNYWEVITILCMGITTYFTRTVGFVWLRKHQISPRAQAVLASSPCCVMVSVVAPSFMTTDPKTLISLAFCILLSFKCSLGVTICGTVAFMALLQNFF